MVAEAINSALIKLVLFPSIVVGFLSLAITVIRVKYGHVIEWHAMRFIGKVIGMRPPRDLKFYEEIIAEITYHPLTREVHLIKDGKQELVVTPQYDSEPEKVIRYLTENPNKDISKQELIKQTGLSPNTSLSKTINNLGFKGENRQLFFQVSKNTIRLNNPLHRKHIPEST